MAKKITHLDEHEHAFIDENNIVQTIAVFHESSHDDSMLQPFAESIGLKQAVCCCTFGKPYIGDTWDETNKTWIETAPRFNEDLPKPIELTPEEKLAALGLTKDDLKAILG